MARSSRRRASRSIEDGTSGPRYHSAIALPGGFVTKPQRKPIPITGIAHIGVRVHDLERSVAFYELLGFTKTVGPIGPEPVAILDHPSGVEINLVLNAPKADEPNILMDVPEKHPGITHFALLCADIQSAKKKLETAGFALSGGP